MLYDQVANLSKYLTLNPLLEKAWNWILKTDFKTLKTGKTLIEGEKLFVYHFVAATVNHESGYYEAHYQYADLHLFLEKETLFVNLHNNTRRPYGLYDQINDTQLFWNSQQSAIISAKPGEFALFLPNELHLPKYSEVAKKLHKIVLKIKWGEINV